VTAVDDYLDGLQDAERAPFAHIRAIVHRLVPDVEEGVAYGMPAFKHRQRPLLGFRAAKRHLSVFPFSPAAVDAVRDAAADFDISKGTIRFTAERPLPDAVVERLIDERMREIDGRSR
jgi:uncharacterized protein YdhG (YjbR/CyaY superfamily)